MRRMQNSIVGLEVFSRHQHDGP